MRTFTPLDIGVVALYFLVVGVLGARLAARPTTDARDYFLADHAIPWWAVCFAVVATETSALTFISVPSTAYASDLWMLQLATGYVIGRIGVAVLLLPGYFRGEIDTAYVLLERRFGPLARRFASLIFLVTRALADGVRIFATAIPVALVTGLPRWQAIVIMAVFTLLYTYFGGLRAVVWVDVVQMFIYLVGGVAALWVLLGLIPGGWGGLVAAAAPADKLRVIHLEGGFGDAKWLFTGLFGGAFLTMASHGADHLLVQRLLAAPSLRDARRALVLSGVLVWGQFLLFLLIGVGLWRFYDAQTFGTPDEVFPRFILEHLPPGISGLVVAAILAAALTSSLNTLAAATTYDLYAPLSRRGNDPAHLLRAGKVFTVVWGVLLLGASLLFQLASTGTPVVVLALQIASFTYGGLLGGFLLGLISRRAREPDALAGMGVAVTLMTGLWAAQQFKLMPRIVDTLWFALLGSAVTVAVGVASSRLRGVPEQSG